MNLHRWDPFKKDYQIETVTQQANVDHCGGCGTVPLGNPKPFAPIIKKKSVFSKEIYSFPNHFRKSFLISSVILAGSLASWTLYSSWKNVERNPVTEQKKQIIALKKDLIFDVDIKSASLIRPPFD